MILTEQLQSIAAAFQDLAKSNGGGVQLCADPSDVFERMKQNPNGLWVYVDWKGDAPWSEMSDVSHVKRRSFTVILYRSRLAQVDPAAGVVTPIAGIEAGLILMQEAVETVNELRFNPNPTTPDLNDGDPTNIPQGLTSGPHFTYSGMEKQYYEDSFEITFSIAVQT